MGLFSKIKNVLFEEEEIEIPVFTREEKHEEVKPVVKKTYETPKVEVKREVPKEVVKKTVVKEETPKEIPTDNERETFKTEPTFQFPVFDESEFDEPKKVKSKNTVERVKKNVHKIDFGKYDKAPKEKEEPKRFVPSPVISPVFGVLDKNYTKKDFTARKEEKARVVDVDSIRNKAYGTLEDDIENTFKKPVEEFYEEKPTKSIDDLLIDSVDEEIAIDDIPTFDEDLEPVVTEEDESKENSLDLLDDIEEEIEESKKQPNLDDTLESDLFNLIDSMYSNREEDK